MNLLNAVILTLVASILFYTAEAFSPAPRASLPRVSSPAGSVARRNVLQLRASEEGNDVGLPPLPSQKDAQAEEEPAMVLSAVESVPAESEQLTVEENEETSFPIDLPSPVLLATSMVLAISSTGEKPQMSRYLSMFKCRNSPCLPDSAENSYRPQTTKKDRSLNLPAALPNLVSDPPPRWPR